MLVPVVLDLLRLRSAVAVVAGVLLAFWGRHAFPEVGDAGPRLRVLPHRRPASESVCHALLDVRQEARAKIACAPTPGLGLGGLRRCGWQLGHRAIVRRGRAHMPRQAASSRTTGHAPFVQFAITVHVVSVLGSCSERNETPAS